MAALKAFDTHYADYGKYRIKDNLRPSIPPIKIGVALDGRLHQPVVDDFLLVELLFQRFVLGLQLVQFGEIIIVLIFHDDLLSFFC